jgi:DNA-binding MarR family transcriptional regulator
MAVEHQPQPPVWLTGLPSWQLNRAAMRANRIVEQLFADEGLGKHHFACLVALDEDGPLSQAELGRRLAIDRSDLHAVVGRLEERGFVDRVRDEADRRRNLVGLTPTGGRSLRRLQQRVLRAQEEILAPLPAADRRAFLRGLDRLR